MHQARLGRRVWGADRDARGKGGKGGGGKGGGKGGGGAAERTKAIARARTLLANVRDATILCPSPNPDPNPLPIRIPIPTPNSSPNPNQGARRRDETGLPG